MEVKVIGPTFDLQNNVSKIETHKKLGDYEEIMKYNSRQVVKETCKFLDKISLNQNCRFTCVIKKDKDSLENELSIDLKIINNKKNFEANVPYDIDEKKEISGGFSASFFEKNSPDAELIQKVPSIYSIIDVEFFELNYSYDDTCKLNSTKRSSIIQKIDINSRKTDFSITELLTMEHTKENCNKTSELYQYIYTHSAIKINELAQSSLNIFSKCLIQ